MRCKACQKVLKNTELKSCSHCDSNYHYHCVGIAPAAYAKELKQTKKVVWKCTDCCKASEKRSENTNTPVRPDPQVDSPVSASSSTGSQSLNNSLMEELKRYIDDKLKETTQKILSDVRAVVSSEIKTVNKTIEELKSSVSFISCQYEDLNKIVSDKCKIIDDLQNENSKLIIEMNDIKSKLAAIDQQSRACNIEIQCIPEHKDENLLTITKHLSKAVSFPLAESDIVNYHRIPKANQESDRPRSIVVKLLNPRVKDGILAAVKKFNRSHATEKLNTSHVGIPGKKQPFYVAEHLSPENKKLHAAARRVAKEKGYEFVWVRNGRIFMRKDTKSKIVLINCATDWESF